MALRLAFTLTVLCASLAAVSAADDVVVGTGDNFEQLIKDNAFVVAEFYAPWCGHCKNLEPEYAKAATELKKLDPPITLVKVDATEEGNKELASKYGVQGFPTLKIFRDGNVEKPQDYNGPRDSAGIVSYLQKQSGPASKPLTSAEEVSAFKKNDPAIIGVFKSEKASEFKAFSKVANSLRDDFDFAHTFEADLVEGAGKAPAVILIKEGEGKTLTYDGAFKVKDLTAWVDSKGPAVLPELDQSPKNKKALQKAFESPLPKLLGFVAKDDAEYKDFVKGLTEAAESKDSINFILVDPSANAQALSYFGIVADDAPAYVIQDATNDAKYIAKNTKPDELTKFIEDFEAGKLEKTIKSEEPPEDNNGPVTIVTAKTFDEIVLGGKDVLIEFYAPWCGHCKKLTPIYEKVGEHFASDDNIVIAKVDATANDVPASTFEVKGFPTLAFVSGKDGSVHAYSGDRSEDDLIAFVKKHASKAVDAEDSKTEDKDEL
jgi:protein disulfide-isomerase A1